MDENKEIARQEPDAENTASYEYQSGLPDKEKEQINTEYVEAELVDPVPPVETYVFSQTEQAPVPPQPSAQEFSRQEPPGAPQQPQQPGQQPWQPQQQTQWTFHDYGPMGMGNPPPEKKKEKKAKKSRKPNFGIKVFAIVMSALFVLSTSGFAGYVIWQLNERDTLPLNQNNSSGGDKNNQTNDGKPSLDLGTTPDTNGDVNQDGTLSNREIYNKVSPSVVGVAVYVQSMGIQLAGQGSGIVMSEDGYIITNCHVVTSQDSSMPIVKIEVIMNDGETYTAQLVGGDTKTDLAVLKINADNLTPAEFGDSDKLSIGDRVLVLGNPNGIQFAGSMTLGMVSALDRTVYMSELDTEIQYIQTDAAINPGNSGGAFINEYGQVVGVSSAKMRVDAGFEGMGFAIPINNAKGVIDSLIAHGYVTGRPKIGIKQVPISETISELNGIPKGLRVHVVEEDSDALKQGVVKGDIITKIDGKEVYDATTIGEALDGKAPGDKIVLTIYRVDSAGKASTIEITVTLGEQVSAPVK